MSLQHLQILWRQLRAGVVRGFFTLYDFLFSAYRAFTVYMTYFIFTSLGMPATSLNFSNI
jgi:hypothetical protein